MIEYYSHDFSSCYAYSVEDNNNNNNNNDNNKDDDDNHSKYIFFGIKTNKKPFIILFIAILSNVVLLFRR